MPETIWVPRGVDVETLRAEEAALRAQERELRSRLELVKSLLQTLTGQRGHRGSIAKGENTRLQQIVHILEQSETPMSSTDIYARLRELDPRLNWTNPAPVFRSYIRRQQEGSPDLVVRLGRGLYGLQRKHTAMMHPGSESRTGTLHLSRASRKGTILAEVEGILREQGGPLSVADILARLQERGVRQKAANPRESLKVNLGKSRRFVRVLPGEYDLAERHPNPTEDRGGGGGR